MEKRPTLIRCTALVVLRASNREITQKPANSVAVKAGIRGSMDTETKHTKNNVMRATAQGESKKRSRSTTSRYALVRTLVKLCLERCKAGIRRGLSGLCRRGGGAWPRLAGQNGGLRLPFVQSQNLKWFAGIGLNMGCAIGSVARRTFGRW